MVDVPTTAELDACYAEIEKLATRVSALEGGGTDVIPPPDAVGVQAMRVRDALDGMGVVCFPNSQDDDGANAGGHATADAHATAFNAIYHGTGFAPWIRLYCEQYPVTQTVAWCKRVAALVPGTKFLLSFEPLAAVPNTIDIMKQLHAAGIPVMAQGQNESNNSENLGTTATTAQQSLDSLKQIYAAAHPLGIEVLSPSMALLYGMNPDTFIRDYYGALVPEVAAHCDLAGMSNYPNGGGPAHEMQARTQGAAAQFGHTRNALPEFHDILYNNTNDRHLGAMWAGISKLSSKFDFGTDPFIYFDMYDYIRYPKPIGLFQGFTANPSPAAGVMRALFKVCADTGADAATFAPGKLDIRVSGLPAGFNQWAGGKARVMQCSDKSFRVALTHECDAWGGSTPITVSFGTGMAKVVRWTQIDGSGPVAAQEWSGATTLPAIALGAPGIQVLEVHP